MKNEIFLKRPLIPVVIIALGAVSLWALHFTHDIHEQLHEVYLHDDMIHEVQRSMLESHLWLEELVHGGRKEKLKDIIFNVNLSVETLETLLTGGETFHATSVHPIRDETVRSDVSTLKGMIENLQSLTEQKSVSGELDSLDEDYDTLFTALIDKTDDIKESLEMIMANDEAKLSTLFSSIMILWVSLLVSVLTGLTWFEYRRKKHEEELVAYRDNLESQVENRTAELQASNTTLENEVKARKQTEKRLKTSRETYRELSHQFNDLLEAIDNPIVQIAPDFRVLWANSAAAAIYGKSIAELQGQHGSRLCGIKSDPCEQCPTRESFKTARAESALVNTSDGRSWDIKSFPIKGEDGNVSSVIEIREDVTEKVRMQAEAIRAGQLASLGELAAGVAHEINNPINGIINFAQMLEDDTQAGSRDNDVARLIIHEGDRIAGIVKSLLSFARHEKDQRSSCDVSLILSETLSLIRAQLQKEHIALETRLSDALPPIHANFQQIEQVFLNLINNARYSLNEKYPGVDKQKVLEISGRSAEVDGSSFVHLEFKDHGQGIPEKMRHKVLAPFFTTKPKGSGTGLGLSLSQTIITEHGGLLSIDTVEGQYTNVAVDLPVADASAVGKETDSRHIPEEHRT